MTWRRLLWPILLAASAPLLAQRDTEARVLAPEWSLDEVQERLASEHPVDVAWAAYCVAERGMKDALPAVRGSLRRLADQGAAEVSDACVFARMLLLDATIGLSATLTLDELQAHHEPILLAPLLILAARDPERSRPFLAEQYASGRSTPDMPWRVAGNLLAATPQPGQVLEWLQSMVFSVCIRVYDSKSLCRCRCYVAPPTPEFHLPANFPPIPLYLLDESNAESRGQGLRSVPFARTRLVNPEQLHPQRIASQAAYRDWLRSVGDRRTEAACSLASVERSLTWTSSQQLRKAVAEEHGRILRAFQAMVAELDKDGRLPPAAASSLRPNVDLEVLDYRGEPCQRQLPTTASLLPR